MFRLLCTFLSVGCCFTLFRQAHTAAVTDPNEAKVIESLAEKWDLRTFGGFITIGNPCTGRATDGTNLDDTAINLGIKCDCSFDNGTTCHVVRMKVTAQDRTGEIPEELANLTYLQNLNLAQNYFTGPIPTSFGNLTSMQYLSVATNNLSGPVPKELGNLHNLISLSIAENNLKGTLPPELGSLTALEQLYIQSAGLSGVIPSTFRKLQKLKTLWASDNQFTGGIPDFIGTWKNLTDLRLQGNAFQGPIPSSFSNLTSLKNLRVSDIMSGVSSLSFLKSMKQLTTLVLRNNMISGELPSYIGELTGLQILDLSFNNFSGGIPYSLQSFNNLESLLLGNNNLSGKLPSQRSPSLVYIDLSYNGFSGALPTWFTDNNLIVNIVGNYFSTIETDNRFPGKGLGCLQRNFPCNKGAPQYSSFAINCGGPQQNSSTGTVYEQDIETLKTTSFYVSNAQKWGVSNTGLFVDSINSANIATSQSQIALYRTARLSPSSLRYYGLGLQNGPYTVTLLFAEIQIENTNSSWKSLGRRIFDVYIQGQKVLADFNIANEAGSPNTAVVRYFNNTHVTSNFLEIHFFWAGKGTCCIPAQGTYGPLVSAISVAPEFNPTMSKKSKAGMSKKSKAGIVIGITIGIATALIYA